MFFVFFFFFFFFFLLFFLFFFFFFQAEDGIRDADVTGVQTCALPILGHAGLARTLYFQDAESNAERIKLHADIAIERSGHVPSMIVAGTVVSERSEERRVGKECRSRWWRCD